jgi:hypothetical protein
MGFSGTLRKIFFSPVRKEKWVKLNRNISRKMLSEKDISEDEANEALELAIFTYEKSRK